MAEGKATTSHHRAIPAGMRSSEITSLTAKEVLGILRRHIFMIFFLTLLGLIVGGGTWKFLQRYSPKYTATTYIQVLSPVPTDPWVIGAAQLQKDILYAYRRSIANLIKQQSTLEALVDRPEVKKTNWFIDKDRDIRRAVRDLNNNFIANPHRDSEFVEISMTCQDADEAAEIVNEMLDLFIRKQTNSETKEITDKLTQLEEQRRNVEADLKTAEDAMEQVRTRVRDESGITDLEMPVGRNFQHTVTLILQSLESEKIKLDMAISQLQADISNLEELATGPITEQIEFAIEKDPLMTVLAQQLAIQEAQLTGLLTRFGENHREVLNLRESIEETKKQRELRKAEIADITRQANLKDAKDYLIVLQEWFDELEVRIQKAEQKQEELDIARVDYDKRLRIRDERQATLDEIKEQIEKWRTKANDPETPKVQSVGLAPRPLEMVFSRQWWMWLPSGTMLGFLLGIGLAFLVEITNDLVRTPSEIFKFLRIPLLAVIPNASEDNQVRGIELCHAVRQAPYSIISEAYRRFSMNLKLSGTVESLKTILISSGMPGDGKTSTAVNLATTFVGTSKKVLLIDANFRKPSLNILFPKVSSNNLETLEAEHFNYGLSSVLMRQCSSSKAKRPSGIEGLDIIDCGPLPANPAELLSNPQMEELLKEQRKKYDHIIIDGAPVLLVSDAKAVAGLVDTTVLVFNADSTNIGAAQRTISEMRDVNANIAGCILFAARTIKGGYFREQSKSYRKYLRAQLAGN